MATDAPPERNSPRVRGREEEHGGSVRAVGSPAADATTLDLSTRWSILLLVPLLLIALLLVCTSSSLCLLQRRQFRGWWCNGAS
eukprot:CAMPEP_0198114516 /NCGR_PEP_ID=MMETSP1442-20131203/5878_1 /TAXON_ID= /ORGANISM="Craspedostauros australis, Strain CCMP3328" /LENGTH=83 /DNA_ID=CAMNT_0043771835 /DNA_START=79 /DNA_END=327 /DNA_ORIENTATION=+